MHAPATFVRHGPADPVTPVILSVPHAGRTYPAELLGAIRVPPKALIALEDRHVDRLALAARRYESLIVADRARAWIDLNRAETERDPRLDDGVSRTAQPVETAKIRSGLGLVPRRVGVADIWSRRLSDAEVRQRIREDHRPYHHALSQMLAAARARFGVAVLLDIHSMPPLAAAPGAPRLVLGDRFGRSASSRFVARLEAVARAHGVCCAANIPYAGGHILERHAAPHDGIHAIQIEFDRSLYLCDALAQPGPGLEPMAAMLRQMIDSIAEEAIPPAALAAE